ncbi:Pre-mRNA-splicing factor CWC25 [Spathaspora sp. JA1]|nr:Pre-mRNA-splicing factor CWC25 [Spathaspora sp. JA1]
MAGDLNLKKSWNPALVKNQKRVWDQEQAKLEELTKINIKNEEFTKEQDYLNLLKFQYGNDFKVDQLNKSEKLKLNKLNWMYEDVPFEEQEEEETKNDAGFIESKEEFNEGKAKVENLLKGNHTFKSKQNTNDRLNRIIGMGKTKSEPESLSDDPLIRIKQQQQRQKQ